MVRKPMQGNTTEAVYMSRELVQLVLSWECKYWLMLTAELQYPELCIIPDLFFFPQRRDSFSIDGPLEIPTPHAKLSIYGVLNSRALL